MKQKRLDLEREQDLEYNEQDLEKPNRKTYAEDASFFGRVPDWVVVLLGIGVVLIGCTVIGLSIAVAERNSNVAISNDTESVQIKSKDVNNTIILEDGEEVETEEEVAVDEPKLTVPSATSDGSPVYGLQPDCFVQDMEHFNICFDLRSESQEVEPWMDSFLTAKRRWEQVIVADNWPSVNYQWDEHTGIKANLEIDDTIILAENDSIDGVGGIMASAIPANMFEIVGEDGVNHTVPRGGWIKFDDADIEDMMKNGDWENSILHEVGHVLGIGHMWVANGLYDEQEGVYTGKSALEQWKLLGCSGPLPVETDIGEGTDHGHWDEQCLKSELMTGLKPGPGAGDRAQKLSAITIGALEDLGYIVDYRAADPFDFNDLGYCSTYCPNPDNGESSAAERGNDDDVNGGGLRRRRRTTSTTTLSQPKVVPTEQERIQMLQGAAKLFQTIPSSFASSTTQDSLIIYYKHDNGSIERHLIQRDEARRHL